jgi:putative serine protease PepD
MTDHTPEAPGDQPDPAEHSGDPAEAPAAASGTPETTGEPTDAEPSPWAPAGYQQRAPETQSPPQAPQSEQPTVSGLGTPPAGQSAPYTGGQPAYGQPVGEQPGGGFQTPGYPNTGSQPAAGYQTGWEQPTASYPTGGYPGYYPPADPSQTGPQPGQPGGPQTQTLAAGQPRQRGRAGLIVGVAALALVVGGAAGGLGGYLASGSGSNGSVVNSLNQPVPAQNSSNTAPAGSVQAAASKVLPVVVEIAATFQSQQGESGDTGSGVVISSSGDILTNNHVVQDAATSNGTIQVIFSSGKIANATVVGRDPTTDIAVIKAGGVSGLPTATLGDSGALQVGQNVVAIGAPFQLSGTVTSGIVSSLHRPTAAGESGTAASQDTVLDAIQTDAAINPGNSGGPLINLQGQVVGINSAIYSPSSSDQSQGGNVGIGFAIPIDQARRTAQQIVSTGQATQTVLGVSVADSVPASAGQQQQQPACESGAIITNGALITQVTAGGPADKAGLKPNDVVVQADGKQVNSCDGLVAAVHADAPGDQMKLTLNTGATVTATLAGQPVKLNN